MHDHRDLSAYSDSTAQHVPGGSVVVAGLELARGVKALLAVPDRALVNASRAADAALIGSTMPRA
jgi:hypothetical protein